MAIYHCHISVIGGGRSAVAAAAYRAGEKLNEKESGKVQDYTHKQGVAYQRVYLPENAPAELADRETLWNKVQDAESHNHSKKGAQFAREVEVALPREMSREQQIEALDSFIEENFTSKGMIADLALHDKGQPHAHIMLTMRELDEEGNFCNKAREVWANDRDENGKAIYNPDKPCYDPKNKAETEQYRIPKLDENGQQKVRERKGKGKEYLWEKVRQDTNDWNSKANAEKWRENWAKTCNRYLDKEHQIDHRSYREQGIEKGATIHEGYAARQIEKRGKISDRCEINRTIKQLNKELDKVRAEMKALDRGHTMSQSAKNRLADIVGKDNAITAGFSNNGGGQDKGGERWDLMTEQRKDEIRHKNLFRDSYGDEEKSLMSDWKPKQMTAAPENIFADIFKDKGEKDDDRGRGNDDRRAGGRTDRTNDSSSAIFERAIQRDFATNQRSAQSRGQGEGREDLDAFIRSINAKIRSAEVSRANRDAEQRRLIDEREQLAKGRDKKAKGKQREDTGLVRTR